MTIHRLFCACLAVAISLAAASGPAWADRGKHAPPSASHFAPGRSHVHDRYYPPRGHVVQHLPPHYHVVPYRDTHFYFHAGIWYRPSGTHFVVALPPVGLLVPFLPPYYTTVWVGSAPYYYAGGVYYRWHPQQQGYVVSELPRGAEVIEEPPEAEELFVYPRQGQSEEQQASDRYECHRWALGQTGFDPTKPGGNVPAAEHARKHEDYQRALRACLEARNYSVR